MAFGRRVVGDEAYNARQLATKGKAGFGHRVTGATPPTKAPAFARPPVAKVEVPTGISIEQIDQALGENSNMFDPLFEQELARAEGPRVEALRVLRAFATGDTASDIDNLLADAAEATRGSERPPLTVSTGGAGTPADLAGTGHASVTAESLAAMSFGSLKDLAIKADVFDPKTMRSRTHILTALLAMLPTATSEPKLPPAPPVDQIIETPPAEEPPAGTDPTEPPAAVTE